MSSSTARRLTTTASLAVLVLVSSCTGRMPAPPPAGPAGHFPSSADLYVMLRYLVEDGETPGIVLGVLEADGSTRVVSYGTSRGRRPLGPRSVFEMGSTTKAFTGALLAEMVGRGEVSLDDPVSRHLPAGVRVPSRNGREITLLDLATHRSSLPRMPPNLTVTSSNPYPPYTLEDLYTFLAAYELPRDIGAEFEYSNIGVALLGHALARAAGGSYEEVLRARILEPLGMRMTSNEVRGEMRRWMTRGHDRRGHIAPYRGWPELPAMGGLRSNAEDMLRFLAANLGEPRTPVEHALRAAREPRAPAGGPVRIGLNWLIVEREGRTVVLHGGTTAGYDTEIAFDPERRVGVVRLTNTADFDDDIGTALLMAGPLPSGPEAEVAEGTLRSLAGVYELAPGRALTVRMEREGYLTLQEPGKVRYRMYADSDSSFHLRRLPWRVAFQRGPDGAVTSLTSSVAGRTTTARRTDGMVHPPAALAGNAVLDLPLTPAEMAGYEGTYVLNPETRPERVRVFVEGGRLMMQPGPQRATPLRYQGEHRFIPEADAGISLRFTVEAGRATHLTFTFRGQDHHGPREEG